ncbi:MAG: DUF1653 domain-containing protein [Patescibacteria group bacterium]|jgi:putative hydrolase of HD superfamily
MKRELKKILDFLVETEKLKLIERIPVLSDKIRRENDAEHSWHLALMVMALKDKLGLDFDLEKALQIALVHDLPEIYTGDTWPSDEKEKKEKSEKEKLSANKIFALLPEEECEKFTQLWQEYEDGKTIEAKIVKALDKICYSMQFSISNNIVYFDKDSGHTRRKEYAEPHLQFNETLTEIFDYFSEKINQEPQPAIKPGKYRHFKGNHYRVISTGKHSETGEEMVVYTPLYQSETKIWIRPASMFFEEVGSNGQTTKRFTFLG